VELLRDCGANIILGDVGAFDSENAKPNEPNYWLAELKRRYGVRLVDFAAAGARMMKAGVYYPRDYLITNALIDTDLVINCANCQPHFRLFLNGAVRNMFNGLVGHCQDHIYEVFKSNRRLSRVIADVCRVIRPSVSVLDMISVREANSDTGLRNVGLILAGKDPASIDTVAAHVMGWQNETVWTTYYSARKGLGYADIGDIDLRGIDRAALPLVAMPIPDIEEPADQESRMHALIRLANKIILRPRPVVNPEKCDNSGACKTVCPVGAITAGPSGRSLIDPRVCVDCLLCARVCQNRAINLDAIGGAKLVRKSKRVFKFLWAQSKVGLNIPAGPITLSLRARKRVRVSRHPRRFRYSARNAALVTPHPPNPTAAPKIHRCSRAPTTDNIVAPGSPRSVVLIVGAGPGLGASLGTTFSEAGMDVVLAARRPEKLEPLAESIRATGRMVELVGCDAQSERSVGRLFAHLERQSLALEVVVYNVEHFIPGRIVDIDPVAFEECWRVMCFGAFLVGRASAKYMLSQGRGTIIFTGATASMRGRDGYINMAVGKFGIRALAQSMARELGPQGIHVAHAIIDGGILGPLSSSDAQDKMNVLFPQEIASTYLHLHQQHPSAWTQEIDLRPWVERF
jgi:NAD(P)-dependent dehydrogenase (short-subunit alcohol dehydrogenase family)/uncharacterized protein (DUF362 family)/ferredoxin